MSLLVMTMVKSFAMLVGQGEAAPPAKRERREIAGIAEIDNRRDWAQMIPSADAIANLKAPSRMPEARYAYYRRCQQFRRNGEQCKAPAMKGEHICHRHAEQGDTERRRKAQRRELLSRPGAGLGSFRAIQRTISELAEAILADSIDRKAAGRLMVDIQVAIRLQKMLTTEARRRLQEVLTAETLRRGELREEPVRLAIGKEEVAGKPLIMKATTETPSTTGQHWACRRPCASRRDRRARWKAVQTVAREPRAGPAKVFYLSG
jgi:hypothetical protein